MAKFEKNLSVGTFSVEWPQQTKLALEYMNGHSRTTKETPLPHPTPNLAFYLIKEISTRVSFPGCRKTQISIFVYIIDKALKTMISTTGRAQPP